MRVFLSVTTSSIIVYLVCASMHSDHDLCFFLFIERRSINNTCFIHIFKDSGLSIELRGCFVS